jgi:hypothetical protein
MTKKTAPSKINQIVEKFLKGISWQEIEPLVDQLNYEEIQELNKKLEKENALASITIISKMKH